MTVTPDPNQPQDRQPDDRDQPPDRQPDDRDRPQDQPPNDRDQPPAAQPTDAFTSMTSVTAAPDPAPVEAEGPGEDGHEVAVETTRAAAAHTVAYPGPIPDYAMETSVERPVAAPVSDAADPAPTGRYPADPGLTVPLTVPLAREPQHPLPPDPSSLAPEAPFVPEAPLAPEPPYPVALGPAYPDASVRPRRRPLFGTILWGVILLALAGYVLLGVLVPAPADPTLWLLGGVILIGLLLIVIGIVAALRRAG